MSARFSLALVALTILSCGSLAAEDRVPPQQYLFTNVMVFDGVSDELSKADVLLTDNKIDQVSKEPLAVIQSTNMTVIDGGGRTLMPGLIDSHVHLTHVYAQGGVKGFEAETWDEIAANATAGARRYLMNGFTTVRDMGGMGTGIKRSIGTDKFTPPDRVNLAPGLKQPACYIR